MNLSLINQRQVKNDATNLKVDLFIFVGKKTFL